MKIKSSNMHNKVRDELNSHEKQNIKSKLLIEQPDEHSNEICWGRNAVIALLEDHPERCLKVFISNTIQPHVKMKIIELCKANNIVFHNTDNVTLDRITEKENHQGVSAFTTPLTLLEFEEFLSYLEPAPNPALLVICDHLQDPHNIGAIIRSAEAAGASAVLLPKRGGCMPTGTIIKTSAGAALRLPIVKIGNISQTIKRLQEENFWVTGLDMEGRETLFKEDLPPRSAIVSGAEGDGLGKTVKNACDDIRFIPMYGKTGSLNASVATAVAMFEWSRSVAKFMKNK